MRTCVHVRNISLNYILHLSPFTLRKSSGFNRSAVTKHLKKMQETGIILREGPDKGGHWVIIDNND